MKNTSKKKVKKAGDIKQNQNFFQQNLITLEQLNFGENGTKLRLVESESGKTRYIQLWSTLSKQWGIMYRQNVDMEWQKWKDQHARIHARKQSNAGTLGRDLQLGGAKPKAKRKPRAKPSNVSTKDSKQSNGKQGSKSPGRVQRPTKKQSQKGLGKG